MKTWTLRLAIAAVVLVGAAAATLFLGAMLGERKLERRVDVKVRAFAFTTSADVVERGRYLFLSRGCTECHGTDAAGRTFIDDGAMRLRAPNLTGGRHGVVASYSPDDWVRAVRHGVAPSGRALVVMPSEDYARWTDGDLNALVAYLKQVPAVDGEPAQIALPLPVKALYGFGVIRDAAEKIDHTLPPATPVPEGVTAAHGAYVAQACIGCHGEHLSGGKVPGAPPDWPAAANLTPGEGSAMVRHYASADAFAKTMRSGRRPDGSTVSPVMPFQSLAAMSDTDLQALHLYLQTVPARPAGER